MVEIISYYTKVLLHICSTMVYPWQFEKLIKSQEEAIGLRNILIIILKMGLISHSLSRCARIVYYALTGFVYIH